MRKHRKKNANWGGKRVGAGRKRELSISDRQEMTSDFFARMQIRREISMQTPPYRETVIRELMAVYGVSHRMVERVLAEHLPEKRPASHDQIRNIVCVIGVAIHKVGSAARV